MSNHKIDLSKFLCKSLQEYLSLAFENGEIDLDFVQGHISNCKKCNGKIPNILILTSKDGKILSDFKFLFNRTKKGTIQ